LVGVAVKVTNVPAQTGFAEALMEILTRRAGVTVMVTGLQVAGFPVGHRISEVRTQVTTSPLFGMYE
jgi:hypothetical protein